MKPVILSFLLAGLPLHAQAADPAPFPDFTFKKIAPPQPGTRKRITVQIAPVVVVPKVSPPTGPSGAGPYQGFWTAVGTGQSDLGPARLEAALRHVTDDLVPPLRILQPIASAHGRDILAATIRHPVSPALVLAVMAVESAGDVTAVSSAGAQGLMQLMPDTADAVGITDPFDATQNITGGAEVLARLLAQYDGDAVLALAAYNAGTGAVGAAGGVPDYPETRGYVPKVLGAWRAARSLCVTPPDLATDPCVFATQAIR